jgi:type II secretory pathway predicted ATPase ExeA
VDIVRVDNPLLTRNEFVELLARRFDLTARAELSKATLLSELEAVLLERRRSGQITALVIDEAQALSTELLEEVRLLANLETTTQKLLPLVMAGQPELRDRLNEPGLRQLKQRVTLRCEIAPFSREETASYIAFRIATAGGEPRRIFTRDAVLLIHEHARGIPRVVSVLSDNALLTAFGLGRQPVDSAIVAEVVRDFDVDRVPAAQAAPAAIDSETVHTGTRVSGEVNGLDMETEQVGPSGRELFATSAPRRFRLFGPR